MTINNAEIQDAIRLWRATAPAELRNVVDAKQVDGSTDVSKLVKVGLIVYIAGRYLNPYTGNFIALLAIREALETVVDVQSAVMRDATQQLIDGKITVEAWQEKMEAEIITTQITAALAANGGLENMSQDDWDLVQTQINEQVTRLDNFARQIRSGEIPLDGRLLTRANLYADAAIVTFEIVRTIAQTALGWEQERRYLEPTAAHCEGCIDQAQKNWQPIGTLEPIGSQECGNNCRCTKKYRRKNLAGVWIETEQE